ncbi:MAG: hypothetical protein IKG18_00900 [Atopobiaceae bacterium]|nr:hypothetical protein [Atopobiaceae bacterium]MBR3312674.1 hypothetical protein [Atopobiaceae bacterium]
MRKAKGDSRLEKLEDAVRKQAGTLDPAQREFVLAEFDMYRWNAEKIDELQRKIGECDRESLTEEAAMVKERHQLMTEQASMFSHIMRWLKGTSAEQSPLDEFF